MAAQSLELNPQIRLIGLQFNGSNSDFIPTALLSWLRRMNRETTEGRAARKSHANGIKVIEETERCSLRELLGGLEVAGYELVDTLYQERIDAKDPRGKRTYHMVRFLFARHEFAEISDEFKTVRNTARDALRNICETAFWRVRSFINTFYKDGEEVPGFNAASINLELRVPLYQGNGKGLVVARLKNELGKSVGDPLPLRPDFNLRVVDDAVSLIRA